MQALDSKGVPALIYAAYEGHKEVIKLMLSMGAKVNALDLNQSTALVAASGVGHIEIVDM